MITIKNLHFSYLRKPVLSGLSLALQPGYIYGLLGRNGAGKSTLLKVISGLLFPQKGELGYGPWRPAQRKPSFLQHLYLLPEEFHVPPIRIGEWVKHQAPFYPRWSQQQFISTLTEFDIPSDIRLTELSYGQQKKALISFALSTNTGLLLMDEPTNGLDIPSKSQFRKVIAGALGEGSTILISTHQVKDLENLIDRILVLDQGRILFNQPLTTVSRKLRFHLSFDPAELASAIYGEPSLRGNSLVTRNDAGEDGQPDLEMLYKAIIHQPERLNAAFTN
jgi:ABC-2 type transport system ATP-binding protein